MEIDSKELYLLPLQLCLLRLKESKILRKFKHWSGLGRKIYNRQEPILLLIYSVEKFSLLISLVL